MKNSIDYIIQLTNRNVEFDYVLTIFLTAVSVHFQEKGAEVSSYNYGFVSFSF